MGGPDTPCALTSPSVSKVPKKVRGCPVCPVHPSQPCPPPPPRPPRPTQITPPHTFSGVRSQFRKFRIRCHFEIRLEFYYVRNKLGCGPSRLCMLHCHALRRVTAWLTTWSPGGPPARVLRSCSRGTSGWRWLHRPQKRIAHSLGRCLPCPAHALVHFAQPLRRCEGASSQRSDVRAPPAVPPRMPVPLPPQSAQLLDFVVQRQEYR